MPMTEEGEAVLAEIRAARGYTLPLHDILAETHPDFLRRYGNLASHVIFGDAEGRALDAKTRFLVLVGITTAVKGDREGIEWATRRAMQHGATFAEVVEAAFLAGLPAGMPAFEGFCRAVIAMREGEGLVPDASPEGDQRAGMSTPGMAPPTT